MTANNLPEGDPFLRRLQTAKENPLELTINDGLYLLACLKLFEPEGLAQIMGKEFVYDQDTMHFLLNAFDDRAYLRTPPHTGGVKKSDREYRWNERLGIMGLYYVGMLTLDEIAEKVSIERGYDKSITRETVRLNIDMTRQIFWRRTAGLKMQYPSPTNDYTPPDNLPHKRPTPIRIAIKNSEAHGWNKSTARILSILKSGSEPPITPWSKRDGIRRRLIQWGEPDLARKFQSYPGLIENNALISDIAAFSGDQEEATRIQQEIDRRSSQLLSRILSHEKPEVTVLKHAVEGGGYRFNIRRLPQLLAALRGRGLVFDFTKKGNDRKGKKRIYVYHTVPTHLIESQLKPLLVTLAAQPEFNWLNKPIQ